MFFSVLSSILSFFAQKVFNKLKNIWKYFARDMTTGQSGPNPSPTSDRRNTSLVSHLGGNEPHLSHCPHPVYASFWDAIIFARIKIVP
jgi:hypothetical protein